MEDNLTELAAQHEELSNEDLMELEAQSKEEESQEEEKLTEKLKRFLGQEIVRGFFLFKEALLVFEERDPNIELCTKFAAAVQNVI